MIVWFSVFVCFSTLASANFVDSAPSNTPLEPISGLYPRNVSSRPDENQAKPSGSRSRSSSESNSQCRSCKNLTLFNNETLFARVESLNVTFSFPEISYFYVKDGCNKAILNCPMDGQTYTLTIPFEDAAAAITSGVLAERVVTCNSDGKYQATSIYMDGNNDGLITVTDDVPFAEVVCVNMPF